MVMESNKLWMKDIMLTTRNNMRHVFSFNTEDIQFLYFIVQREPDNYLYLIRIMLSYLAK